MSAVPARPALGLEGDLVDAREIADRVAPERMTSAAVMSRSSGRQHHELDVDEAAAAHVGLDALGDLVEVVLLEHPHASRRSRPSRHARPGRVSCPRAAARPPRSRPRRPRASGSCPCARSGCSSRRPSGARAAIASGDVAEAAAQNAARAGRALFDVPLKKRVKPAGPGAASRGTPRRGGSGPDVREVRRQDEQRFEQRDSSTMITTIGSGRQNCPSRPG
jgi:hypothetical protein